VEVLGATLVGAAIVIGAIVYLLSLRNRRGNANKSLST
jgi:hypothetical protein